MSRYLAITLVLIFTALALAARAQEAYFITYSHHMEDTGDLEVASKAVAGTPKRGNTFLANALEFEYGIKPQWTAEVYLDGQTTIGESTAFTGFRIENRIRPLTTEHRVNPVLYFELEDINSADKTLLEIVGHDRRQDFLFRPVRIEREREAELRLILSSNFKGWHASQNTIFEKNLAGGPWEFGYAVGINRRLGTSSGTQCPTYRQRSDLGAEAYGGLGDTQVLGPSRYIALLGSGAEMAGSQQYDAEDDSRFRSER